MYFRLFISFFLLLSPPSMKIECCAMMIIRLFLSGNLTVSRLVHEQSDVQVSHDFFCDGGLLDSITLIPTLTEIFRKGQSQIDELHELSRVDTWRRREGFDARRGGGRYREYRV